MDSKRIVDFYEPFTKDMADMYRKLATDYTGLETNGTPIANFDHYALEHLHHMLSSRFYGDYMLGQPGESAEEQIQEVSTRGLTLTHQPHWIIDGLGEDGNFHIGNESYGAMVVRRLDNDVLYAAVLYAYGKNFPAADMMPKNGFVYASQGKGAWRGSSNGKYEQLRAVPRTHGQPVVMLAGSSSESLISALGKAATVRSDLATCVAAVAVASGGATALVTKDNKLWKNWLSALFVTEAGGVVTDLHGNPLRTENCGDMIAAANEDAHAFLLNVLNG